MTILERISVKGLLERRREGKTDFSAPGYSRAEIAATRRPRRRSSRRQRRGGTRATPGLVKAVAQPCLRAKPASGLEPETFSLQGPHLHGVLPKYRRFVVDHSS
jgi:hypothetical protein